MIRCTLLEIIPPRYPFFHCPLKSPVRRLIPPDIPQCLRQVLLPSGKSILLIDDDDPWSRFAQTTLTSANNTVTRSATGQAAPVTFDLVLVDDVLEQANSQSVLKQLSMAGESSKIIVVVSDLRVERVMELMQFGVRDVLLKPYTPAALAKVF